MTLQINLNLLADNNGVAGEPLSRDRIAVNDSFFVEIEVADLRDDAAGVIGLTLDIEWDVFILEALDAEITNELPFNPQGIVDNEKQLINERGLIEDFGAGAIPNFDLGEAVGINELERFALIRFQGELETENPTPLTVTISDPRNVAFADGTSFNSDEVEIEAQTIEVTEENNPPRLVNRISDLTTLEDREFSFTIPNDTFRDIDQGDRLSYSAMLNDSGDLPDWLSFDPETRTLSGTPDNGDVGTLELKVRATDDYGKSTNDRFLLTVENTNDKPQLINRIDDLVTLEDREFSFTIPDDTFRDIDQGDRLSYSSMLNDSGDLPDWLSFDPETRTLSGTPDNGDVGTLELKVRATDDYGKSTSDRFLLTVKNVDDPPVVSNRIADVVVDEDSDNSSIDLSDTFRDSDRDDNEIVKTVVANTNEDLVAATISEDNLTLDYQENRSGKAEITIQAESNGETVTDTFGVTVNSVDDLPIVSNPLDDVEVNENAAAQIIDLSNVFSDLDGDEIALDVRTNDNDLVTTTLDGTDLTLDFLEDRFGSAEVTIEATANSQVISNTFTVRVNEVVPPPPTNTSPILANEIADVSATEDSEFDLTISSDTFIDPNEGDRIFYAATLENGKDLPAWLTFDPDTKTFSGTPDNSDVGTLNLEVTVADNEGETASDRFFLTVENVDDPPVVSNPIADVVVDEDSENTVIDLTNLFNDVDDENSEIALTVAGNSNDLVTASIEDNQITLDYLPDRFGSSEIIILGESNGKTIEDTFTINVNSVNDPPTLENPLTDDTTTSGKYFELTIAEDSFSDRDLEDSLIYSATTGDGSDLPAWLSFATDTQTFSGTPENTDVGDLEIAVRATDSSGAMVSDRFTLAVESQAVDRTDLIVYRFFNLSTGVHFYTVDEVEKDYVLDNLSNYTFEGETYAAADPLTGGEEVYRFFNDRTGAHLYTTDEVEKDFIIENLSNYSYEGIKFYAYETPVDNSIPVYRFYEPSQGVHFYTPNEIEKTFVEENLSNYDFEEIAYYAFPTL